MRYTKIILLYLLMSPVLYWSCSTMPASQRTLPIFGERDFDGKDTIYKTIPDFKFTNQDGQTVSNHTVDGKIYVADFFFTTCPTICPKMKMEMLRVHQRYKNNPKTALLSHTIDPKHDTIALLKDYAQRLGANTQQWHFLWTDNRDALYQLAEKHYLAVVAQDSTAEGGFIHSGYFILIDTKRRIRGYYDGTDPKQVDLLMNDMGLLLNEK